MMHPVLFLFFCFALPAFAQTTAPPQAAAPVSPLETLWSGDAGLDSTGALIKDKKYAEAVLALDTIIQRNIRNTDAHVYRAIALANMGDLAKAKASLTNAYAIDRGHMGAYVVGGLIALREDDRAQAEYYLGAIKTVCQGELCPEYSTLRKAIMDHK